MPVHTSDAMSIAMPREYRDVSTVLAAFIVLVKFVAVPGSRLIVIGGSVRGRKRVAIMTPDETIATAIFAKGRPPKKK